MKRTALLAAGLLFCGASAAQAGVVLQDNFSAENGGQTALNYTGFSNFTVNYGSVDLVHTGDAYGINCGSSSACIDLDGSTNTGGDLLQTNSFSFEANQLVTLTVSVSGNQRSAALSGDDDLGIGFRDEGVSQINNVSVSGFGAVPDSGIFPQDPNGDGFGYVTDGSIPYNQGFQTYSLTFSSAQAGTAVAEIFTDSADNYGPILNDVTVSISAAPEPGAWALMLGGVGILGGMLRVMQARRREDEVKDIATA